MVVELQSSMPALKNRQGPIWYQLWLDVRHIPIAIYKILLNGPFMLITFGMSICGPFYLLISIRIDLTRSHSRGMFNVHVNVPRETIWRCS